MVFTWRQRLERLQALLRVPHAVPLAENADHTDVKDVIGEALEYHFESQQLSGRSSKGAEIENLRFGNRDLVSQGTLATGQFGVIDIVRCQMNGLIYVRKTIKKNIAVRYREQCSVQFEREILTRATISNSAWTPHLLCSFQTSIDLNLVMDYAEGGSLADVLGSAPEGQIVENDLLWWMAQAVAAISWCHAQGFVHRDIKPENFVLTTSAHLKLIDFGCAAPLLTADPSGVQLVPRQYCLVPCGTCDYIAPEILQAHEEAIVAAESGEMVDTDAEVGGYGREVDWWSFGAMMYELACGMAPFFARDVAQTYQKITEHERHPPRFKGDINLSDECKGFIQSLLVKDDDRLGRKSVYEIKRHPFLKSVKWAALHLQPAPVALHLPRFQYANEPPPSFLSVSQRQLGDASSDPPFAFSAFFQSSLAMSTAGFTPSHSIQRIAPQPNRLAAFIGFTWGPTPSAFDHSGPIPRALPEGTTPRPNNRRNSFSLQPHQDRTPLSMLQRPPNQHHMTDPNPATSRFMTPTKPSLIHHPTTIPRAGVGSATARRLRDISDWDALRMMVDCVGASARKRLVESGKKPRSLMTTLFPRFPALSVSETGHRLAALNGFGDSLMGGALPAPSDPGSRREAGEASGSGDGSTTESHSTGRQRRATSMPLHLRIQTLANSSSTSASSPPPSPSPRPGSAMSKRSGTPGLTGTLRSMNSLVIDSSGHRTAVRSRDGNLTGELTRGSNAAGIGRSPSLTRLLPSPASASMSRKRYENRVLPLSSPATGSGSGSGKWQNTSQPSLSPSADFVDHYSLPRDQKAPQLDVSPNGEESLSSTSIQGKESGSSTKPTFRARESDNQSKQEMPSPVVAISSSSTYQSASTEQPPDKGGPATSQVQFDHPTRKAKPSKQPPAPIQRRTSKTDLAPTRSDRPTSPNNEISAPLTSVTKQTTKPNKKPSPPTSQQQRMSRDGTFDAMNERLGVLEHDIDKIEERITKALEHIRRKEMVPTGGRKVSRTS